MESIVYLDTHVVVWLYIGELSSFPSKIRRLLEEADIKISPIVQLELQYLWEIGRIKVKGERIVHELAQTMGLKICDQDFNQVVLESVKQTWTRDPFDRFIVAQANLAHASLISKDEFILKHYSKAVWL